MKKFTLLFAALFVAMTAFADYFVAGTSSLCGSNWSNNDANNKMTLANGVYTKSYANVPAGSHEFKITNGTWDNAKNINNVDASTSTPGYSGSDNIAFVLTASTNITISYNESTDKITLKAEGINRFGAFTISSYTLCGDFPCFNGDWSPASIENDMTKGTDGVWTKTYESVSLSAKKYQYKVAANHAWGQGEFPTSGNQEYEVKEAGAYNITFKFNPTKPELICEMTKTGSTPPSDNPSGNITDGTNLYLNPSAEWKSDGARFAAYFFGGDGELWISMNDSNGDGIYEVTCQGTREKVIFCRMNPEFTDNAWNKGDEDETQAPKRVWNQTADLTYDGTNNQYNVSGWEAGSWSKYNGNGGNQGGGTDDPEKPQPEASVYTLCGDSTIFGSNWDETDTNNDMTKGEDGIWSKEYTNIALKKGTYEYKVAAGHNWDTAGKYPSGEENMTLYIAKDGKYDISFSFDPTIPELKAVATYKEEPTNVDNITLNNIYALNGTIFAETDITIYSITGQNVTDLNGNLKNGVYIVKSANATMKVVVK